MANKRRKVLALFPASMPVKKGLAALSCFGGDEVSAVMAHGACTDEEAKGWFSAVYYYHAGTTLAEVLHLLRTLRTGGFDIALYVGGNEAKSRFLLALALFSGAKERLFADVDAKGKEPVRLREGRAGFVLSLAGSVLLWALLLPLVFFARLRFGLANRRGSCATSPVSTPPFSKGELSRASVVIPNYNGRELLAECLPSVLRGARAFSPDSEVIVVDDASTDDSVSFVRQSFPDVKLIVHEKNKGFGKACETGISSARNRLVVLLNSDISVEDGFITPLARHFSDTTVFATQPKIYYWEKDRFNAGVNMGRFEGGYIRIWNEAESTNPAHVAKTAPNLYAVGGAMAFDKTKWDLLGGFDPLYYPFCWEDIDVSYRALKRGWKVLYEPGSVLFHKHHGTLAKVFKAEYRRVIEQKNEMVFIWKNIHDARMIGEHFSRLPGLLLAKQVAGDATFRKAFLKAFNQLGGILKARREEGALSCRTDKDALEPALRYYRRFIRHGHEDPGGRKSILVMTPFFPYPLSDGGKIRINTLLKYLSRDFDVHLLSFIEREDEKARVPELLKFCKEVDVVVRTPNALPLLQTFMVPLYFRGYCCDNMSKKLVEILRERPIDLVQIEFMQLAYYADYVRHLPMVMTEHDIGLISLKRSYAAPQKGFKRLFDVVFCLQMIRWSVERSKLFDRVITVTDVDKKTLESIQPEAKVEVINTGTDLEYFSTGYEEVKDKRLVYVGFMGHYPNVDAMLYFYEEVLPLIRKEEPGVTLTIIGSGKSDKIDALKKDPAIDVTGYVDDIRPYVKKGAVFIAPMRKGAGIKGKLLEAMAMCKPIVTTPVGIAGLPVEHGRDLLVTSNAVEFADAVVRLLRDEPMRKRLALSAYEVVKRDFDWKVIARRLSAIYTGLIHSSDTRCG